jgi:hypothetical protein
MAFILHLFVADGKDLKDKFRNAFENDDTYANKRRYRNKNDMALLLCETEAMLLDAG